MNWPGLTEFTSVDVLPAFEYQYKRERGATYTNNAGDDILDWIDASRDLERLRDVMAWRSLMASLDASLVRLHKHLRIVRREGWYD